MRRTGSREPRDSFEASSRSPVSIAVKTFSTRFGSRRNQRAPHQKQRSITTVKPTIETIRIGHMIGPPALKFRMKKFEFFVVSRAGPASAGLAPAAGASVAETAAPVVGAVPGAGGTPGAVVVPGATASGAPGAVVVPGATASGAPGAVVVAGVIAVSAGGEAVGAWAKL